MKLYQNNKTITFAADNIEHDPRELVATSNDFSELLSKVSRLKCLDKVIFNGLALKEIKDFCELGNYHIIEIRCVNARFDKDDFQALHELLSNIQSQPDAIVFDLCTLDLNDYKNDYKNDDPFLVKQLVFDSGCCFMPLETKQSALYQFSDELIFAYKAIVNAQSKIILPWAKKSIVVQITESDINEFGIESICDTVARDFSGAGLAFSDSVLERHQYKIREAHEAAGDFEIVGDDSAFAFFASHEAEAAVASPSIYKSKDYQTELKYVLNQLDYWTNELKRSPANPAFFDKLPLPIELPICLIELFKEKNEGASIPFLDNLLLKINEFSKAAALKNFSFLPLNQKTGDGRGLLDILLPKPAYDAQPIKMRRTKTGRVSIFPPVSLPDLLHKERCVRFKSVSPSG